MDTNNFNQNEKLAILRTFMGLVSADGQVEEVEVNALAFMGTIIGYGPQDMEAAQMMDTEQSIRILRGMSDEKKALLSRMMEDIAQSDGEVDSNEAVLMMQIIDLIHLEDDGVVRIPGEIDLSDIYFVSNAHSRYEDGELVSGPHAGARRAIKIEPNIEGNPGYTATIFSLDGAHPLWGNNIMMAPKQMRVVSTTPGSIELRGWGEDPRAMGHPDGRFDNYGFTIYHADGQIEKIVGHMHDRNVAIEYLK